MLSLPGHAYATSGARVFVNLYVQGTARVERPGGGVTLAQDTRYPWDGDVRLRVMAGEPGRMVLMLRIPGWARQAPVASDLYRYDAATPGPITLSVNGATVPMVLDKGYAVLDRTWAPGDEVRLHLPMPVRRVTAHPGVKANAGRIAVERGPLVYAAEWPDHAGRVTHLVVGDAAGLRAEESPLFTGVTVVKGTADALRLKDGQTERRTVPLTLIPYYAWAHRGPGEMTVWLATDPAAATVK